jgi:hypothetical protein
MKPRIVCLVVLLLLVCLPAAASANGYGMPVSALGGAGYGAPVAVVQAPACGVGMNFGAVGYGAAGAPVALAPVQGYRVVQSLGAAAPLYGGSCSVGGFGASPVIVNQAVIHHRPGLLGRIHAARQAFRRGF